MDRLQRYNFTMEGLYLKDDNGPFVQYRDVEPLIAELDKARGKVESLQGVIDAVDRVLKKEGVFHASRAIAITELLQSGRTLRSLKEACLESS